MGGQALEISQSRVPNTGGLDGGLKPDIVITF